ncbi:hypothetical protein [Paenibacillus aquistagni]|uniref:hypothetical protein n=1 Tax=Paenibacillus aquistagni TaxID=1852522 RepID=UPI001481E9BD|nr:hypothetical protein [Paenibacillus aquistagni]
MKEKIQTLLKDNSLMDQFMQGRLQLEGISSDQLHALRNVITNSKHSRDNYSFWGWG